MFHGCSLVGIKDIWERSGDLEGLWYMIYPNIVQAHATHGGVHSSLCDRFRDVLGNQAYLFLLNEDGESDFDTSTEKLILTTTRAY